MKKSLFSSCGLERDLKQQACKKIAYCVFEELTTPVSPLILTFVQQILGTMRPLGVLFYGSALRGGVEPDTLLDFYIIVSKQRDWPRSWISALGNALLPPNVEYHEHKVQGQALRAKVAILSLTQLRALTGHKTYDTTIWARFSQPCRLVWVRDDKALQHIGACIVRACITAAGWGALLGPKMGAYACDFWEALYQQTYGAELRVEQCDRSRSLVERQKHRYENLLLPCWQIAKISWQTQHNGIISPLLSDVQRQRGMQQWRLRRAMGRPLNIMRLLKAAYTFTGGARYAAWKIRRHSGIEIVGTPFAEKHPLLAAIPVLWTLWQRGLFYNNKSN